MNCQDNDFCRSLQPETRALLCKGCEKRFEKAGSFQQWDSSRTLAMLILDGAICTSTKFDHADIDHSIDTPSLAICLPGYVITNFGFHGLTRTEYDYQNLRHITDTWVARFDSRTARELYATNLDFVRAYTKSLLVEMETSTKTTAFIRANYTYYGVYHFMKMFEAHGLFVSQQELADIMNCNRSSISKAMKRIREEDPALWQAYFANKGRAVRME